MTLEAETHALAEQRLEFYRKFLAVIQAVILFNLSLGLFAVLSLFSNAGVVFAAFAALILLAIGGRLIVWDFHRRRADNAEPE